LLKKSRFSDRCPALLVPHKLETAQNRKVQAARVKPVLPANDILSLLTEQAQVTACFLKFFYPFILHCSFIWRFHVFLIAEISVNDAAVYAVNG